MTRFTRRLSILTPVTMLTLAVLASTLPAAGADFAEKFAKPIEKTHGMDVWSAAEAMEVDITVDFGGQRMVDGQLLMDPTGSRVRLTLKDGTVAVFDGQDAWVSPPDSAFHQGARFHVLTWSYFLAAPMKLRDSGTHIEDLGKLPLRNGKKMAAARLTFDSGVGDTPEDWYVLYRDREKRLAAMAYIVTFGKSVEAAEEEPHAITYGDFWNVRGAVVPRHWEFWNWSQDTGIHGEPIGEVKVSNFKFVEPAADAFTAPEGAKRADMP